MRKLGLLLLLALIGVAHAGLISISGGRGAPPSGPPALPEGAGLAAGFPNDAGITAHASVISVDNFNAYTSNGQLTSVGDWTNFFQSGNFLLDTGTVFEGARSVRIRMPSTGSEVSNALVQTISPDLDTLFVRTHAFFASNYTGVTQAHNGLRITANYTGPGSIPNGTDFMLVEMQNVGGSPGAYEVYVYHPEQDDSFGESWFPNGTVTNGAGPDGGFGPYFVSRSNVTPARGVWLSQELMVQLNTPGVRDGRIAIWEGGVLIADWQNIRFRDSTAVKLDEIQLENGGQASSQINDRWYDNVVIATEYIGPVQ